VEDGVSQENLLLIGKSANFDLDRLYPTVCTHYEPAKSSKSQITPKIQKIIGNCGNSYIHLKQRLFRSNNWE
jgi:hypothetical protein